MLKQLAGQTAIYGVGTIVPRFLNYLLFPYLTRLMTTGEYGVVTDLYALIPFALVVLTMGLETEKPPPSGNARKCSRRHGAPSRCSRCCFSPQPCFLPLRWPGSWTMQSIRRTSG